MKNAFRIVAIALVIAAGVWVFRVLFPGDEKLIRKLLAQAAEVAINSITGREMKSGGGG